MKDLEVPVSEFIPQAVKNMEVRVGTSGTVTGGYRGSTSMPEPRPMTEGHQMISVLNQGGGVGADKGGRYQQ